ncbi:MAG: hypothetical protein PHV82_08950, partial [Victivallaceae bacterium]|nr:hypothetical protein [Victivallaceae bacterium]
MGGYRGGAVEPRSTRLVLIRVSRGADSPLRVIWRLELIASIIFWEFWLTLAKFRSSAIGVLPNDIIEQSAGTLIFS